ncbi:hypothetical protein GNP63_09200 [Aliivibrio fischeri]|uniref:hypothetical protein n=1 Tax=Aliivibrio fischeri TaxID=668 RepID=UPI0012D9169E|nr:hypothetical protein [Aliivibrio fischeri]MUH96727.1 hypothetical protein [Aliivibrio fischeri]MUI63803.1 hypothetical protein [Aliivibrio fischeri]
MKNKSVLIVGSSNVLFTHSYIETCKDNYNNITYIDTGVNGFKKSNILNNCDVFVVNKNGLKSKILTRIKKYIKLILKKIKLDRSKIIINFLNLNKNNISVCREFENFVVNANPDHIIYLWSTTVRKEKLMIDDCFNKAGLNPISILVVNTYPVNTNCTLSEVNRFKYQDEKYFNSFNKIICTSEIMKKYLIEQIDVKIDKCIVQCDMLHPSFIKTTESVKNNNKEKKIVFLGNTDFSYRTIDDVKSLLLGIANNNIEVWIMESKDSLKINHKNIKLFKPFNYDEMTNGKLSEFVSRFDAAILAYNDLNNARSNISYPTRFAMATLGMIPIFLESSNYFAIEEYSFLRGFIINYDDHEELTSKLCNDKLLESKKNGIISYVDYETLFNHSYKKLFDNLK